MIIRIDASDALPVYEQIRQQMTRLVASGQLHVGERLPTIRQLASDLGIARGTVERAYDQLATDGVVVQNGRAGTIVNDRPVIPDHQEVAAAAETFAITAVQAGMTDDEAIDAVRKAIRSVEGWS